ncbi:GNAT family N-acetyltransferase [Thiolapillus sp.]
MAGSGGFRELVLAAQVQAMPFYEKAGFNAEGEVFDEAGIPHRNMVWRIP